MCQKVRLVEQKVVSAILGGWLLVDALSILYTAQWSPQACAS